VAFLHPCSGADIEKLFILSKLCVTKCLCMTLPLPYYHFCVVNVAGARGCLHASHFCYLMAQLDFGVFSHKSSKIVLLGSSHFKPFVEFATNEAIQMTEIYIYACQLAEHEFNVSQFQVLFLDYLQN